MYPVEVWPLFIVVLGPLVLASVMTVRISWTIHSGRRTLSTQWSAVFVAAGFYGMSVALGLFVSWLTAHLASTG